MSGFIGLLLILFILFFPLLTRALTKKAQEAEVAEKKKKQLEAKPIKRMPPIDHKRHEFEFHSELENFKRKSAVESQQLQIHVNPEYAADVVSPDMRQQNVAAKHTLHGLFQNQNDKRKLMIYSTLLSKPKGLVDD